MRKATRNGAYWLSESCWQPAELLNGLDHPYLLKNDLFRSDNPLKDEARLSDTLIRDGLEVLSDLKFPYHSNYKTTPPSIYDSDPRRITSSNLLD